MILISNIALSFFSVELFEVKNPYPKEMSKQQVIRTQEKIQSGMSEVMKLSELLLSIYHTVTNISSINIFCSLGKEAWKKIRL